MPDETVTRPEAAGGAYAAGGRRARATEDPPWLTVALVLSSLAIATIGVCTVLEVFGVTVAGASMGG